MATPTQASRGIALPKSASVAAHMATIADRIREVLKERNIRQNALQRDTGLSAGYISNLDARAGKTDPKAGPNPNKLAKVADYLGVHLRWLLDGAEPKWLVKPPPYGDSPSYRDAEAFTLKSEERYRRAIPDSAFRLARSMPAVRSRTVYSVDDVLSIADYYWRSATDAEVARVETEMRAEEERAESIVKPIRPPSTNPEAPKGATPPRARASRRK